jgi:acyl-CoA reductase-like NAD-dependent aldehyde dehydrogenase
VKQSVAPKTPKLFIGGKLVRSESGRTFAAEGANIPQSSRKDVRDAVAAARKAFSNWSRASAYNRGQVLYRLAEMFDSRDFSGANRADVSAAAELAVHYAGWTDKYSSLQSSVNPVSAPMHNFTSPEPVGVVAVVATRAQSLEDYVSVLLPPLASGNTVVATLSETHTLMALELAESWMTSDLPAGAINLLSGYEDEIVPHLAGHADVDGFDLQLAKEPAAYASAADSIKRVNVRRPSDSLTAIENWVESKTVWHPQGW